MTRCAGKAVRVDYLNGECRWFPLLDKGWRIDPVRRLLLIGVPSPQRISVPLDNVEAFQVEPCAVDHELEDLQQRVDVSVDRSSPGDVVEDRPVNLTMPPCTAGCAHQLPGGICTRHGQIRRLINSSTCCQPL